MPKMSNIDGTDEEPRINCVKSEEHDTDALPKYKRMMPVHFEELNALWPADPRIPTTKSRRAWALARGLNIVNVNNWWYRRRKVAQKLKIVIPKESYDQDVGVPPVIVVERIKKEDVILIIPDSDSTLVPDPETEDVKTPVHIPGSDDLSSISYDNGNALTLARLDAEERSRDITVVDSSTVATSDSVETLKELPLVLQPSVSPPPVTLFFSEAVENQQADVDSTNNVIRTERGIVIPQSPISGLNLALLDALWASFHALEPFYPMTFLPINVSDIAVSSCSSTAFWKWSTMPSDFPTIPLSLDAANYVHQTPSFDAPWCIHGFRVHFDGSMLGLCSCFSFDSSMFRVDADGGLVDLPGP